MAYRKSTGNPVNRVGLPLRVELPDTCSEKKKQASTSSQDSPYFYEYPNYISLLFYTAQRPVIRSRCSGYRAPCTVICEAALSISRRSSDERLTATAPMFSSRRESLRVPGMGTIHGFWASSQASAI